MSSQNRVFDLFISRVTRGCFFVGVPNGMIRPVSKNRCQVRRNRCQVRSTVVVCRYCGTPDLASIILYMARVQVYELSLKQDLEHLFGVSEQQAERMNLSSIL